MVCLLVATACASDGGDTTPASSPAASSTTVLQESTDETTTTEPPETTPSTAASTTTEPSADDTPVTTTAPESAPLPSGDTVEVPFFVIDASIPAGWTCASVSDLAGFYVTFSDEVGERTVVEARTESVPLPDGVVNTTCAAGPYNGTTALVLRRSTGRSSGRDLSRNRTEIPVRERGGLGSRHHRLRDDHPGGGNSRALRRGKRRRPSPAQSVTGRGLPAAELTVVVSVLVG